MEWKEEGRQSSWREHAGLMILVFAGSLALRGILPHGHVFVDQGVLFRGTDAWYHLRLIDNLLAHFPYGIHFDPYLRHPGGAEVAEAPLFDFLLALVAWVAGAGQPTPQLVEALAAWYPAVLGALVTIPVYLSAHVLWGRPAGVVASALIAVLPGRFLERSLLAATDHHVAEVLSSSCCLLFLLLAIQTAHGPSAADGGTVGFGHRWRSTGYAMTAGLALAAYLLIWRSGSGLPLLLLCWIVAQLMVDRLRGRSSRYLAWVALPTLATALVGVAPWLDAHRVPYRHAAVLLLALLASACLIGLSIWRHSGPQLSNRARLILATAAASALAAGFAGFHQFDAVMALLQRLQPTEWGLTVAEMRPLQADDSVAAALFREFRTAGVAAAFGLALLSWKIYRGAGPGSLLLLVWSLTMIAVSLAQRRFTYYLAVVVALLSAAAVSWALSSWASTSTSGDRRPGYRRLVRGPARPWLLAFIFAILLLPNIGRAVDQSRRPSGPDPAWIAATRWLRSNTPEPFADPDFYLAQYPRDGTTIPNAAYGLMAWWDRGFWLIRLAHRVPIANPKGHGIPRAASFYLAQESAAARRLLAEVGARYVIVDDEMPIRQVGAGEIGRGTLNSMAVWLERPLDTFVERYEVRSGSGTWRPIFLYYPGYFRTMAIRLQTFSGKAVVPRESLWVVSFKPHLRPDGTVVKRVTRMTPFSSHRQATDYLSRQPGGNHRLVSTDPAASCVPLAAPVGFKRVYPAAPSSAAAAPPVQIFEVGR